MSEFTYEVEKLDARTLLLRPHGDCLVPTDLGRMLRTASMFLKGMGGPVCAIYDLDELGRTGEAVRPLWLEWEQKHEARLLRTAAYCQRPVTRVLASTMLQAPQRKRAGVFASQAEALAFCRDGAPE